jgi:DNA-binding beta-propeller fold protein YncE
LEVRSFLGRSTSGSVDGVGTHSTFTQPLGIALSHDDAYLYIADMAAHSVRGVEVASGTTHTVIGLAGYGYVDGSYTDAKMISPRALDLSSDGRFGLVAEEFRVRYVDIALSTVATIAGGAGQGAADGPGLSAKFQNIFGLKISPDNSFALVCDTFVGKLRRIELVSPYRVTTIAQNLTRVTDVAISSDGTFALIGTYGATLATNLLRRVDLTTLVVTTLPVPPIFSNLNGVSLRSDAR